jgi:AcrR family transcriptional regulator
VAVGSVYRLFADKDAVLRSAYDRFFATLEPRLAAEDPDRWRHPPLDQVIPGLVNGIVAADRAEALLLAGLIRYADSHQDVAYRQHATALRVKAVAGVRRLLLSRSKEIGHPEPEAAVDFMLFTVGVVLKGVLSIPLHPPRPAGPRSTRSCRSWRCVTWALRGEGLA